MNLMPAPQNALPAFLFSLISLIICSGSPATAEDKVTLFRDGSLHQREAVAIKGLIDLPLADGLLDNSMRIIPDSGTTILGVEIRATAPHSKTERERETLFERRRRLEDRLRALATREEIFKAAAKSQSGKALRKTKTNPDPMQAIRQGTDFAIAQLEAVYSARRNTEREIKNIDEQIATVKRVGKQTGKSVRIAVSPPRGRVRLQYATSEAGWKPSYQLHLSGDGMAQLQLSALLQGNYGGYQLLVSPGSITNTTPAAVPAKPGKDSNVFTYRLPLRDEHFGTGIFNRFSGRITNTGPDYLPPGETTLFKDGTYLGKFVFSGLSSGKSTVVTLGE